MKWTVITMGIFLAFLISAAIFKGNGTFQLGLKTSAIAGAKFIPILLIAFFVMGFTDALLPKHIVETWLSESSGIRGILVAWLAGILTPGGSIIGMPLAAGLFKAGAGISIIITYLTSMALLSIIRMPLEIGFYGIKLMTIRILATALIPPLTGFFAQFIVKLFKPLL